LTFIITEMDKNTKKESETFITLDESSYVTCTNDICEQPRKYILQKGKNIQDGDSFFCKGTERKGVDTDRCFRQFIITKTESAISL